MRESRHLRLIAATGLLGAFAAIGCSDDPTPPTTTSSSSSSSSGDTSSSSSSASSSSSGEGGGGGSGGNGGSGGAGGSGPLEFTAQVVDLRPFDAVPSNAGDKVYVVGLNANRQPVVAAGTMDGSMMPSTPLLTGVPLVSPTNIAISSDDKTLYVADPGAENAAGTPGQIFRLPAAGGTVVPITRADGYRARGLDVVSEAGKDVIYFSGTNTVGAPGVFKVAADDSTAVVTITMGGPLTDPSGLVVNKESAIYLCDTAKSADGRSALVEIIGGNAAIFVGGIRGGYPCGVTMTADESAVLISAFDPVKHTDAIMRIDVNTKASTSITAGIDTFVEAAGFHRAKSAGNTFAWVDSTTGGSTGTVFKLTF